jgi:hypothetical protein
MFDKTVRYVNKAGRGIDEHLIKPGTRLMSIITARAKPAWWSTKIKRKYEALTAAPQMMSAQFEGQSWTANVASIMKK